MGQLHIDSSIRALRYLASRTIFSDSPLASMITGLIKVLTFVCSSLFTGDMISYCSKMSTNLFTLSCKCIGTLLAFVFLKIASGYKGNCSGECCINCWIFQQQFGYFFRIRFVLFENVEKKHNEKFLLFFCIL